MKKTLLLIAALVGLGLPAWAYDFSAVAPSGQTLYYNIVNGNAVVTYPGASDDSPYEGYTKPEGALTIPATVNGYHFQRWNNGATDNPYSLVAASDTAPVALFAKDADSQRDTVYITVKNTVYIHDTTLVNVYQYDTTLVNVYDTTIVNIYDTTRTTTITTPWWPTTTMTR